MGDLGEPQIIYEDPRFVVIEKPAGWLVHAVSRSETRANRKVQSAKRESKWKHSSISDKRLAISDPILTDWLLLRYPEISKVGDDPHLRPGIVHRLDREVSGVMVVARTQEYFQYLKNLFQTHAIKKFYYAIVSGAVEKTRGIIATSIGMKHGSLKRSVFAKKNVKEALTEYRVAKYCDNRENENENKNDNDNDNDNSAHPHPHFHPHSHLQVATLLEIQTHTGRTHQIRVHLASIGHPILGDELYGKRHTKGSNAVRIYLHAFRLEFAVEKGEVMRFDTEIPESFDHFLTSGNLKAE